MGDAIDSFFDKLKELEKNISDLPRPKKRAIRRFCDQIAIIKDLFRSLEMRWDKNKEAKYALEEIRDEFLEVVDGAGSLLISAVKRGSPRDIMIDVMNALKVMRKISFKLNAIRNGDFELDFEGTSAKSFSKEDCSNVEAEIVVGFEEDAERLVEQLTALPKKLQVVSIVGMAGLGKTTLAKKVYHDPYIVYHFHIRAWTYVSQVYRKRDLLLAILSSVIELTSEIYGSSDEKLGEMLYRYLKGRIYLIVMDDIWNTRTWDDMKRFLPNDNVGSRVMFTGRLRDVILHVQPDSEPIFLRFRTEEESWDLLRSKVFRSGRCPSRLMLAGTLIARKCHGLPLAIVVVAGLLANKKTEAWWEEVSKRVSAYIVSNPEKYMDILNMSYIHLPYPLKVCFLYLGAFPEDYEISVQKLIWLWVAEGFVHKMGNRSLEEVAEDYLTDLHERSLIMVGKRGCTGRIKSFRIHDLLRDMCLKRAEEENFAQTIYRYGKTSSSYYPPEPCATFVYSFLGFSVEMCKSVQHDPSTLSQSFKLVRVLDLSSNHFLVFPSEIVQLLNLRYLAIQAEDGNPPASLLNLRHLQILVISSAKNIVVPQSTWGLINLRHIHFKSGENLIEGPCFEEAHKIDGPPCLLNNLQTMSQVCPSSGCGEILSRTPNLKKLGFCRPLISESNTLTFPDLSFTNQLEALKLLNTASLICPKSAMACNPINYPEKLKRLALSNTSLEWNELWTIGLLPNLEVLKLKFNACTGHSWETSEGGFHRLKFLKIQDVDLVHWDASSVHFPSLQRLLLHRCLQLEEVPLGLGDIPTLELIDVSWCSKSAVKSANAIQKDQESKGNDYLKIIPTSRTRGEVTLITTGVSDFWTERGGYGGVLRDAEGNFMWSYYGNVKGSPDLMTMKLCGLYHGMKQLEGQSIRNVVVETDCEDAVDWINDVIDFTPRYFSLKPLVEDIRTMNQQHGWKLSMRRGLNMTAAIMADVGMREGADFVFLTEHCFEVTRPLHVEFCLKKGFMYAINEEFQSESNFDLDVTRGILVLQAEDMHLHHKDQ